ncbi:MAG TPA: cyclic nucleotide-binding domain-containing protein [Terriglobales bacterium]
METLEHVIAEHPFFQGLEPEFANLLVGCASNARFRAGDYIFREGGPANEFYLVRKGKVSLEIFAPQREPIMVETLSAGEILGWSWLIAPYQWKFHARALEDTLAIVLDGKCLRGKCEQNRDFGYELLKRFVGIITQRLESTRFQLLDVYAVK